MKFGLAVVALVSLATTRAGDTVRLAWLDAEGHVSLPSELVKVAKAK